MSECDYPVCSSPCCLIRNGHGEAAFLLYVPIVYILVSKTYFLCSPHVQTQPKAWIGGSGLAKASMCVVGESVEMRGLATGISLYGLPTET